MITPPADLRKTIAVHHLSTTTGKQSYTVDSTVVTGWLIPMSTRQHALEGGEYALPFVLYVDANADVRISDKIVIGSANYYVTFMQMHNYGGLQHKRCTLSLEP